MEAILRKQLKQWQRAFRAEHGREPSKSDMQRHPEISSTYDTWRALSEATSAKPRREKKTSASEGAMAAPPTTPTKPRKYTMVASPKNPFRSPQKPRREYERAPEFPSALVEAEAYESDMSDEEAKPKQRTPVKAAAAATPQSSMLFTPRTKARKRLRGEDVRTPPSARIKRTDSQARALLAQSPPKDEAPHAKRRIFSAPQASLDSDIPMETADEVFAPSPRKGAQDTRSFRPLFRTASTAERSPAASPERPVASSQASYATPQTSQTSATTQAPAVAPGAQTLQLDDDTPDGAAIMVLPYQRFGSARTRPAHEDERDEIDALHYSLPTHDLSDDDTPMPTLTGIEGLSLVSPARHTQRAALRRREKNTRLTDGLFDADTTITEPVHARGDLDADEADSDEWASEASEGEYGLGDGEMESVDIL